LTKSPRIRRAASTPAAKAIAPLLLGLMSLTIAGCGGTSRVRPPDEFTAREVPEILRGTIMSQVELQGVEDALISGFGVVVGLDGTGGGPYPPSIQQHVERELAKLDITPSSTRWVGTPLDGLSPQALLSRSDVAIVLVYAAIPPGLPKGATFDLYITALPSSGTTSLEGGRLIPMDLNIGRPAIYGRGKSRNIAIGEGDVFINPYAERGEEGETITRTTGRILEGGEVTEPLSIAMILDNPSPTRARQIVDSINSRFPREPGDADAAARGKGSGGEGRSQVIAITVPERYRENPRDFIEIIRHLQVDYLDAPAHANRYVDALEREFWLAEELAWALEAIGPRAIQFVRPLYDSPEPVTRFYALRVGARLGDQRTATPLGEIASTRGPYQVDAIALLKELSNPRVDMVLRRLAADDELTVRVAAYEALAWRAEQVRLNRALDAKALTGRIPATTLRTMREKTRIRLFPDSHQGIERIPVGMNTLSGQPKFLLDIVPYGEPLVYVTQQGLPRIVLFGEAVELSDRFAVNIWTGQLMFRRDGPTDAVHAFYRAPSRDGVPGPVLFRDHALEPTVLKVGAFLASRQERLDPTPALDLTYSDTVGAVAALIDQGAIDAGFATETDRLRARLLAAAKVKRFADRADSDNAQPQGLQDDFLTIEEKSQAAPEPELPETLVVPIRSRGDQKGSAGS
jgi:flagellar basal body P-ring protein FlgI